MNTLRHTLFAVLLAATLRAQTVSVTPDATTYSATGGSVTFAVAMTYEGELTSLAFEIGAVPVGWSFGATGGTNRPQISPGAGLTGAFEFAYTNIPASPSSFTFTANYSAGLSGNQRFSSIKASVRFLDANGTATLKVVDSADIILTPASGGGVPPPVAIAPAITLQPVGAILNQGDTHTLTVAASGTPPLTFQWRRDGLNLAGSTGTSLVLSNVTSAQGGSYSAVVNNSAGSATSAGASVTVKSTSGPAPPQIATPPASATVVAGASVTLTVAATGTAPFTYQWRKDGVALPGATAASLALNNMTAANAGSYTVVVSNAAGTATSGAAILSVTAGSTEIAGTYVGTFGGNSGNFALLVRPDRTGVFVGYAQTFRAAVVSRSVTIDAAGRFSAAEAVGASPRRQSEGMPPVAAQEGVYGISGAIAADGTLTGSVAGLDLTFSAPRAPTTGETSGVAGFYQSGAAGSSAVSYAILSPAGVAILVAVFGTSADGGRGTVAASGAFSVTTPAGARMAGNVGTDYAITTTFTPATGPVVTFQGANPTARSDVEKLINISTRSRTGTATDSLIAGFVVTGTSSKPVLVRAIGPTLAEFGVAGALSAARLEVFRGATSLAVGNNWGDAAGSANDVADAAVQVGAFSLARTSRDAAVLLSLAPGNYSVVVTGQGGAAGVALVEVYDATIGAIPRTQRIINIATRSRAGSGDEALIAGFVIAGTQPKRLLVRGAGPALAQFGVADVLGRPELAVFAANASTALARNAGWSDSPDVAAIPVASAQAGAFAFPVGSADAAIVINLSPGAYTAQLQGVGGATGNALIEIYELP